MPCRPGTLAVLTALLPERGEPLVVATDLPCRPLVHHLAGISRLVDQEAIPVLGIIQVGVQQRVRPVGLDQFGLGDLMSPPAVVRPAGELQDPQGHRDGDPVIGELAHERVQPFRQVRLGQVGSGAAEDLVLLLQQAVSAAGLSQLRGLLPALARSVAVVDVGLADPFMERHLVDTDILRDLRDRDAVLARAGHTHDVVAELSGAGSGRSAHPSRPPSGQARSDVTYPCGSPAASAPGSCRRGGRDEAGAGRLEGRDVYAPPSVVGRR